MRVFLAAAALLASLALLHPAAAYDSKACNQSPQLCNKKYSSIWHLGAHDIAFVRNKTNNWSAAGNQWYNATVALDAGVRLLQSQLHKDGSDIKLCHSSCSLFDGGTLTSWLTPIATWMFAHPSEVVTMLLVNDDGISASDINNQFKAAGLSNITKVPTSTTDPTGWPTLQSMIDADERMIVFLSREADTSTPALLDEFTHIFETSYDVEDAHNYSCVADRPSAVAGQASLSQAVSTRMGFMNHFLYTSISQSLDITMPNDTYSAKLNGNNSADPGNLLSTVQNCTKQWGRSGGFVLVDFFNMGSPIETIDGLNNVTTVVNRVNAPTTTSEDESSSTSGGWSAIQSLASGAKNGTAVSTGQWIFSAGSWIGTIGGWSVGINS